MAIEDIKKDFGGGGMKEKPEKTPSQPKDTTIFGGKSSIPIQGAAWKIRKASPYIPGSGGAMFSEKERMDMAKELASGKYGNVLEKGMERSRIFKELYKEKTRAQTGAEKLKIDRKIRYLQGLLGK